jgi:pimeloyl-ACP methyl ester carboxylesterase
VTEDVRAIVDHLAIERFAVVGRSGGGPHALAVAAGMPDRVTAVAVLASFAPAQVLAQVPAQVPERADRSADMCAGNSETFAMVLDEARLLRNLTETAARTADDPESFIDDRISDGLSSLDHRVIENVVIRRQLAASYGAALRGGNVHGWIDDLLALHRDWGFRPATVRVPTLLWHGADDRFSPVANTCWLAGQMVSPTVAVDPHAGHFGAIEVLPQALSWLVDRHREVVGGGRERR